MKILIIHCAHLLEHSRTLYRGRTTQYNKTKIKTGKTEMEQYNTTACYKVSVY